MRIRAKFQCHSVTKHGYGGEEVKFGAVYAPDGENASWAKATPNGSLQITIDNPSAQGAFVPGKCYFLDFSPVE